METIRYDFHALAEEHRIKRNLLAPVEAEYVFDDDSSVIFNMKLVKEQGQDKFIETITVRDSKPLFCYDIDDQSCVYRDLIGLGEPRPVHWLKAKQTLINFAVEKLNSSL
jgi:hypothetical protein